MNQVLCLYIALLLSVWEASSQDCSDLRAHCQHASGSQPACGYRDQDTSFQTFENHCLLEAFNRCSKEQAYVPAALKLCVHDASPETRRVYGESCPMFCPEHYRPVCGASKLMDYKYRAFKNGCYLDMLNCRGGEEYTGYVEVPLSFCSRHPMKNIWSERIIINN